ncbi:MAG: rod shape-determining protein RodA [Candidatus Omnitrophica bacterium]|nr:rod shape-determining protein RodA [Candidatus Omnitrophota bacterium]
MSPYRTIWTFTLIVIAIGLVALYSASYENVRVSQKIFYDQLACACMGVIAMYFISRLHHRFFFNLAYPLYGVSVVLLLAVLFAGRSALGATRWFNIGGISFQPSELSKLAVILMLSRYYSARNPRLSFDFRSTFRAFKLDMLYPFLLMLLSFLPIFKQPDLGSALLVFGIFVVMLFMSGVGLKPFLTFLGVCLAAVPVGWHFLKDYQRDRLLVFMNPNADPLGAGYTIIQSRIAVGSGQLAGKGWLAGTQNQLNFLPERHTDFIFSVIGEEWGFLGSFFLVGCYFALIYAGLEIARRTKDRFGHFMVIGIVSILTLEVVINISMTIGLSPVVGITLPLVSWGRTSFMVFMVMMGILLNFGRRKSFGV